MEAEPKAFTNAPILDRLRAASDPGLTLAPARRTSDRRAFRTLELTQGSAARLTFCTKATVACASSELKEEDDEADSGSVPPAKAASAARRAQKARQSM
jgi:hypothetical protein